MKKLHKNILLKLLALPTAPYMENAVRDFIVSFCKERNLSVEQDTVGNMIVTCGSPGKNPFLLFAAHMDHPGFIIEKNSVNNRTTALFYGGVEEKYFKNSRLRFFTSGGTAYGKVVETKFTKKIKRVRLVTDYPVCRGDLGMWDLPACRMQKERIRSRACDDLVGCAALLSAMDEIVRRKIKRPVQFLFTVAEEAGLHGSKAFCLSGKMPENAVMVSVETSSVLPGLRIGDGAVIRTGDRKSIFDDRATEFLRQTAVQIKKKNKSFTFQRKLMDAGTCEASVFQAFGYRVSALCIPLGNYHNRNQKTGKIASEIVSASDFEKLVMLITAAVENSGLLGSFTNGRRPKFEIRKKKLGEFFLSQK